MKQAEVFSQPLKLKEWAKEAEVACSVAEQAGPPEEKAAKRAKLIESLYKEGLRYRNGEVSDYKKDASDTLKEAEKRFFQVAHLDSTNVKAIHNLAVICYKKNDFLSASHWSQKAAKQGFAPSQYNLGNLYLKGEGTAQSDTEAANWFKRAADQAHVNAKHDLEAMCKKWFKQARVAYNAAEQAKNQEEKEKLYKQAFYWFQKAAEQGDYSAQTYLGNMYKKGQSIEQSDERAVEWYQKAAESGDVEAYFNLGFMYMEGRGVRQSDERAVKWYKEAAEKGFAKARCNFGYMYYKGRGVDQSDERAVEWYQKAAEQGLAEAQFNLGVMYYKGCGIEQSNEQAAEWYHKAAVQGHATAKHHLENICEEWVKNSDISYSAAEQTEDPEDKKRLYNQTFSWCEKAAQQGHAIAQINLGDMYEKGQGVSQSDVKAFEWFQKAAEQGLAPAQVNLGCMCLEERGISQSAEKAFEWFQKAAGQNNEFAQCSLGFMYLEGRGVEQSAEKAFEWFQKAAAQEYALAQGSLGLMYLEGCGVEQSDEKAFEWYQKAAEQGNAEANFSLGVIYEDGYGVAQSNEKAFEWYQKAAEQGLAQAQFRLGDMYVKGQDVSQSNEKAFEWYQKAAEQGVAEAQFNFGVMYEKGYGVSQSDTKAVKWYKKAAEQGFSHAQNNLGVMYEEGRGVDRSEELAMECYKRAAEQGLAEAQASLGSVYCKGRGVLQSDEKAFEWTQKAAEQGNAQAQHNLGTMYEEGRGVLQSNEKAFKLYKEAAEQGFSYAQRNLAVMYCEGKGTSPSAQQATYWFQSSANQENKKIHKTLAISYFLGHGALINEEKAFKWFQKPSKNISVLGGLYTALSRSSLENICFGINLVLDDKKVERTTFQHFSLARFYLEKIRDKNLGKNSLDVAKTYKEFAEIGDTQAQLDLGVLYHFGMGVRQDLLRAVEWYEEASQRGNKEARNLREKLQGVFLPTIVKKIFSNIPIDTHQGFTDQDVFEQLKVTSDEGNEKALHQLGQMHLYGWGTEKNEIKAIKCFKKSIEKERYPLALKALADVYQLNNEISPPEVIRLYRHAAKQGDAGATAAIEEMVKDYIPEAIYALAKANEEGWGIAKDKEEALELYRRAAFEGEYPKAQYAFAIKAPNDPAALDLLSRAAGAEEWKAYLKVTGKKYNPKDLKELEQKGPGYYKAQQALADFYLKGRIIPFKTFENVLKAYENALRLQEKAFASEGKHLQIESIIQTKSKNEQLKKSQKEGRFSFQKEMTDVLKNFPSLYKKKEEYDPDFLYQVTYLSQKSFGQETANKVHNMLQLLSSVSEKRKQTKVSRGLMDRLIKTVESERSDELTELSALFDLALLKKSWSLLPSPDECSQSLQLSETALKDPQIENFNSCIQTPDQPVEPIYFTRSVEKILGMFKNLEEKGLIVKERLFDKEDGKTGTYETLKDLLTHNKSDQRFAYRIVRLSDMLDLKIKLDPEHIAAQLMSWAKAGHFCRERSELETYQYYLAQITDPNQDLNELGKDYWSLELRVALSLARLREKYVDELVSQDDPERVHQVAHLKKKARQELSLIGDAEYSQDTLEGISVKPEYRKLSSDKIKEEVLKKYTPDSIVGHIVKEFESSSIPYEKLFRRLRFQFLREEFSKASKQSPSHLDQSLFKEEDFILSDACDQQYMDKQITLMKGSSRDPGSTFMDWQALKGRSYEIAEQRLSQEFYEDEMIHFSRKGAKALLKGMGYLEEYTSPMPKK